jgi:hypothetical protein
MGSDADESYQTLEVEDMNPSFMAGAKVDLQSPKDLSGAVTLSRQEQECFGGVTAQVNQRLSKRMSSRKSQDMVFKVVLHDNLQRNLGKMQSQADET